MLSKAKWLLAVVICLLDRREWAQFFSSSSSSILNEHLPKSVKVFPKSEWGKENKCVCVGNDKMSFLRKTSTQQKHTKKYYK